MYFGKVFNGSPIGPKDFDLLMRSFVPPTTFSFLVRFQETPEYSKLVDAYNVIKKRLDGRQRKDGHTTVDITIDSVIFQTGHVLLIKRRNNPGKGLWAFPGGYLEENEWTFDGSLRELDEETKLKVPPAVLRTSLVFSDWFEHPGRSEVGRTITHAFCYQLPDFVVDGKIIMPKVKGANANGEGDGFDDAGKQKWFTFNEFDSMSSEMFDDHYDIGKDFINRSRSKDGR